MDQFLQKVFQEPQYVMGNIHSNPNGISFEEIESQLNLLIELPEADLLSNFSPIFVQEKLKYFQLVSNNIKAQKASFLINYKKTKYAMDQTFIIMSALLKNRQESLEKELRNKSKEKIDVWNRQISACETIQESLLQLNSINNNNNHGNIKNLLSELTKNITFIDPGVLDFQIRQELAVSFVENMGRIISSDDLKLVMPKFVIGGSGNQAGEFCRPWGVCSDSAGHIFVSDRSNHRVQVFNELGEFILQFGKEGSQPGEFNRPAGIAVNINNEIIVCDKDNHRIQIFTYSGRFIRKFGSQGDTVGKFSYPWGVATNKNCEIAVTDSKNHRIQLFNEYGTILNIFSAKKLGIAKPRMQIKLLDCPRGVAFKPDGSLLVTDFNNHRILVVNKNFNKCKIIGCEGSEAGKFFRPQGIACDDSGRFAVADCKNYRIQVFDANNRLFKGFGSEGVAPGQFDCPQGICFHPNGGIIVVDFNNDRIQVF